MLQTIPVGQPAVPSPQPVVQKAEPRAGRQRPGSHSRSSTQGWPTSDPTGGSPPRTQKAWARAEFAGTVRQSSGLEGSACTSST